MNRNVSDLSQAYERALRRHLKSGPGGSLGSALSLGRRAVSLGLETLELARIHESALLSMGPLGKRAGLVKRAELFFNEAITPIVETHRAARRNKLDLQKLNETLVQRTRELAATNLQLKRGINRRKNVEEALRKSGLHYTKLLRESLLLQKGLRQLTHRVLAAQEAERKSMSVGLQDEIAQTLLGINVRLLTLRRESNQNSKGLTDDIADTQNLVARSAKSVRRIASEIGNA